MNTTIVNQTSPELLRSEIDSRIVKIRPMSTPVDQISRHATSRRSGSMTVEYYSVDSKPISSPIAESCEADTRSAKGEPLLVHVKVKSAKPFARSESVIISGASIDGNPVTGYIHDINENENESELVIYFTSLNAEGYCAICDLTTDMEVVRMGRAARELDVQTDMFRAVPTKERNYCQIFKTQVEQSTLLKLSNKEVGWTFSDHEEAAIIDMRMGMERNFLFGTPMKLAIDGYDDVMLTGGIWRQCGKEVRFDTLSATYGDYVKLCRRAFTGSNGSSRKILLAGSGLIERLQALMPARYADHMAKFTRWGLDFTEMITKFGTLYVIMSETFDQCGRPNDGIIIDPEYITKYSHIPFQAEKLDLRKSGQRNSDAIVITEASCLVLRYPDSHMRVVYENGTKLGDAIDTVPDTAGNKL